MDRTIHFGDDAADARYRIQDTSSAGGDLVLAEDLDGGTVLLEYDYSASEWVSRGPVNLDGNDITNAGAISADTLEANSVNRGHGGLIANDLSMAGEGVHAVEDPADVTATSFTEVANAVGQIINNEIPTGADVYGRFFSRATVTDGAETLSIKPALRGQPNDSFVTLDSLEVSTSSTSLTELDSGWTNLESNVAGFDLLSGANIQAKITGGVGLFADSSRHNLYISWRIE